MSVDTAGRQRHGADGMKLDPRLLSRLQKVTARVRWYVLVEGAAWVVCYLFAALFLQFLVDYGTHGTRWSIRAALLAGIVAGAVWLMFRCIIEPLRVRCGIAEAANLVERKFPQLRSGLISAVRFASMGTARDGQSWQLMDRVIEQAERRAAGLEFCAVLEARPARRAGVMMMGVVIASALSAVLAPNVVSRWFERNVLLREVPWPKLTRILLDHEEGDLIAARGDDVLIQAFAEGRRPRDVEIVYRTGRGQRGRETMVTVGREEAARYRHTFKNAQEDLVFHLRGGDDQTEEYRLRLMDRPAIESTTVEIRPPAYTRLDPIRLGDGQRSAQMLPGSDVTIEARTNKPVVAAALKSAELVAAEAERQADGTLRALLRPESSKTYQFALTDEYGLENKQTVSFAFRLIKDDAPVVKLRLPGVGDMVTPQAVLPLELECSDTYGLASAAIEFQLSRDEGATKSLALPPIGEDAKSFTQRLAWRLTEAGAVAGEALRLSAHAADFDDVSGPNIGRSAEFRLRVVTPDEMLAELARREQEHRADFERLVDAQEQLRGQLLSQLRHTASGATTAELAGEIAALERRQRNISVSVNVIRQQIERIQSERRINQLDTAEEEDRLGRRIVEPLSNLARRELIVAADAIRQWSLGGSEELGRRIDAQQELILRQMRDILASMLQWEGYQEVVSMLRDILRLQRDLSDETRRSAEGQGDGVFED